MADEPKSYPAIPAKNWFALRRKFVEKVPNTLTTSFVAAAVQTSETAARIHVISPLKQMGIIDKDNKPTDRAYQWRDPNQYAAVCNAVREEIYPQELLDLAPDSSIGLPTVTQWFANTLRIGQDRAKKIASFYFLLLEADPAKETEVLESAAARPLRNKTPPPLKAQKKASEKEVHVQPIGNLPTPQPEPVLSVPHKKMSPSVHIDIHIHIPPEATLDQIDKIFESMGKHLKEM